MFQVYVPFAENSERLLLIQTLYKGEDNKDLCSPSPSPSDTHSHIHWHVLLHSRETAQHDTPWSLNSDISYFGVGGKQAIFFIGSATRVCFYQSVLFHLCLIFVCEHTHLWFLFWRLQQQITFRLGCFVSWFVICENERGRKKKGGRGRERIEFQFSFQAHLFFSQVSMFNILCDPVSSIFNNWPMTRVQDIWFQV